MPSIWGYELTAPLAPIAGRAEFVEWLDVVSDASSRCFSLILKSNRELELNLFVVDENGRPICRDEGEGSPSAVSESVLLKLDSEPPASVREFLRASLFDVRPT